MLALVQIVAASAVPVLVLVGLRRTPAGALGHER